MVEKGIISYAGTVSMLWGSATFALVNIFLREERKNQNENAYRKKRLEKRNAEAIRKQQYKRLELLCKVCGEILTSNTVFCPYCGNEKKIFNFS